MADSGNGTLRDAVENREFNSDGPPLVEFDVAGTITLQGDMRIQKPFITIDGSTAPSPGITVTKVNLNDGEFKIEGTHDVVVRYTRILGLWTAGGQTSMAATITIDGDNPPDNQASNIVLDHLTVKNATGVGPGIWGEVSDVAISWCLFLNSRRPSLIAHLPAPFQTRQCISMHHNVYAKNGEQCPQVRADVRPFNFVNNVIYDWGFIAGSEYGIRIRNRSIEPQVAANIISN